MEKDKSSEMSDELKTKRDEFGKERKLRKFKRE